MKQEYVSQFKVEDFNETDILIFSGIGKGFPDGYITTALKYDAKNEETVFEYAADAESGEIEESVGQILQELEQAKQQNPQYNLTHHTRREVDTYINELSEIAIEPLEQVRNGLYPSEISEKPENFSIQASTKEEMTATPIHRQAKIQEFNRTKF